MKKTTFNLVLSVLLSAFFIFGGGANLLAPGSTLEDYQRWGYPDWFHYVTGGMELVAAVLLALPTTRLLGSALAGAIMAAASGTVLLHGEYAHSLAPLVILALAGVNGWLTYSIQQAAKHSQVERRRRC